MSKKASSISSTNVSEKGIGAVSSDLDVAAQLATGGPEEIRTHPCSARIMKRSP